MKLDRLLSIVLVLMNRKKIQAKELAETFGVSTRTIYRDMEAINQAGIPIVTYPGLNGGIGIMENYRLEKNLLSNDELASIITALQSILSSFQDVNIDAAMQKIKKLIPENEEKSFFAKTEKFFVDFSPWGNQPITKEKFQMLMDAINESRKIIFTYVNVKGETSRREVEPHTLVLKGQKWYLYGFCALRNQFRLFKLIRIKDIRTTYTTFQRREINLEKLPWDQDWHHPSNLTHLKLKIDPKIRVPAEEVFGVESLLPDKTSGYLVYVSYPEDDWLYGFLLSFGAYLEVLEPLHIRQKVKELVDQIHRLYD